MFGNFIYSNPTKLIFGEDSINYLKDELKKYCEEKKDKKGVKNLKYLYAIHSKSIFLFYLIIIVVCILLFIFGASCGGNE